MPKKAISYYVIIGFLLALNIFILWQRNNGYKYFAYKTIPQLYVVDSSIYLKDITFKNDSVCLYLSKNILGNYTFTINNAFAFKSVQLSPINNTISFKILDSVNTYNLKALNNTLPNITITIDHSKYQNQYTNEFIYCNLPGPKIGTTNLALWQSSSQFTIQQKDAALNILAKHTTYNKDSSSYYNTMAIAKFVCTLCTNKNGIHSYELSKLSPLQQLQNALQCKGNLACGNYAAIVGYLLSCTNIANRLVTFTGPAGNWQYGVHYYNEVYLPQAQQWAIIDANSNMAFAYDSVTNKYLNAYSINTLVKNGGIKNKFCYTFGTNFTKQISYDSVNTQHIYYNNNNATITYLHANANVSHSTLKNLWQFYTFSTDVEMYSEIYTNNWGKILLKQFAIIALLVSCVVLIIYKLTLLKQKRRV